MEPQQFTAVDAMLSIWRRKTIVMVVFCSIVTVVGLFTILCDKTYKSEAKLLARLGRENAAMDVTAGLGENQIYAMPLTRDAEINSIAQMIQNKELFGNVVDQIGPETILKKPPATGDPGADEGSGFVDGLIGFLTNIGVLNDLPARERAIIKLQKKIDVETSERSNVINVGFETYDPKLAQEVVEAIVSEYQKQHVRAHRSQGGTEFLAARTEEARKSLYESEKKFEEFKNRTQMISVEDQRKVMVERIAKLKRELMDTETKRRAAESEMLARKKSLLLMDKSQPLTQTEGAGNDGIDGMRLELFRLQVQYEEALSKYSLDHPTTRQAEEQLKAAQKLFETAESQMIEVVEGPSKLYEGAMIEIMLREPTLVALNSTTEALNKQLDEVVEKLDRFNANETEFVRLRRDVQISDDNFKRYSRILQQASMDSSMQENDLSNLSIIQAASLNLKPYRPSKMINLIVGLLAGVFGGCSLAVLLGFREAYLNGTAYAGTLTGPTNAELETVLDIPVIATIPRQPRRLLVDSSG